MNVVSVQRSTFRALGAVVTLGALSAGTVVAGCSSDDGNLNSAQLQEALAKAGGGANTASSLPTANDADPAPAAGASPSAIRSTFDGAISRGDFCGVLTELDSVVTDLSNPVDVIAAYDQLRDSVSAATPLVPAAITSEWTILVGATQRAAAAVERSDGDSKDKSLEGVFIDPEVDQAIDSIFEYEDRSCHANETTTTTSPPAGAVTIPTEPAVTPSPGT